MTERCRDPRNILRPPTKHIRVGPDLSHAVTSVVPGRVHPLVRADELAEAPERGVTLVNFFPLVQRVES